jgi:RNA polymerase sigma-70 factor (ECF subfamily)
MKELASLLANRLSPSLRDEFLAIANVDARLAALIEDASRDAPELAVSEQVWAAHFQRHFQEGDVASLLEHLRPRDLILALGALRGNPAARLRLETMLHGLVARATQGMNLIDTTHDDLVHEVLTRLLFGNVSETAPVTEPRLLFYSGRGSLAAWLGVMLTREALRIIRKPTVPTSPMSEFDIDGMVRDKEDPAFHALRARAAPAVEAAIHHAILGCDEADRALLAMHLVDGLTIEAIAASFGLNKSSVSRRIARIRAHIFQTARESVMKTLALDEAEFQSLLGDVMSSLDVTLAALRVARGTSGPRP